MPTRQPFDLLGERPSRTVPLVAEEPPNTHLDHHPLTTYRGISQAAPVPTVHPRRPPTTPRTQPILSLRPHRHPHPVGQPLDPLDHHPDQMWQQNPDDLKIT